MYCMYMYMYCVYWPLVENVVCISLHSVIIGAGLLCTNCSHLYVCLIKHSEFPLVPYDVITCVFWGQFEFGVNLIIFYLPSIHVSSFHQLNLISFKCVSIH